MSNRTKHTPETLYKVLNADGSCYHGGNGRWHLPGKNKPGKWMPKIAGELKPCANGYHVLRANQLIGWVAPVAVFTVEVRGKVIWESNKGVAKQARLLRRLPAWTEQVDRLFACDCSENSRNTLPKNELDEFDACLLTIRRYAFKMASDDELEKARAWAWARAWTGTWTGAWPGAWARAWARAWAWPGATEEQKAWETARLLQYVHGEVDLEEIRARVAP